MADIIIHDHSGEVMRRIADAIPVALEAVGQFVEGEVVIEIQSNPRREDTGLLKNSITHAISGEGAAKKSYSADRPRRAGGPVESGTYSGTAPEGTDTKQAVYIGTDVEYAVYVHEGTRRMTPNRFLKNAVENNKDQIRRYVENEIKRALR